MANVRMEDVTIKYGDNTVIDNISFLVKEGENMAIVGPSGCGKTTLMRGLCGFIKIASGDIYVDDKLVSSYNKQINIAPEDRNIGVVFQDYAVWPHMTVIENVMYPLKKRRISADQTKKKALQTLKQVRMEMYAERLPAQLSGGQQQRVALARALVSSDRLIVLDEPISNLDANLREEMAFEIRNLQQETGITVIYITHDQEAAMAIADRLIIMDELSHIHQIGTPEEIIKHPVDKFVFEFIGVSNFVPLKYKQGKFLISDGNSYLEFVADDMPTQKEDVLLAFRPMNVELTQEKGVEGNIKKVTYLGNYYDYRVQLGDFEIRVQEDSFEAHKNKVWQEGESCKIVFNDIKYYAEN